MPSGPLDRVWDALRGSDAPAAARHAAAAPTGDEARHTLETLGAELFDGLLLIDDWGRIVYANAAACALLGIAFPPPPGDLLGQTILEATHSRALSGMCAGTGGEEAREATVKLLGPGEKTVRARAGLLGSGGVLLVLSDETELERLRTVRTEFVANVSHELRTPLASIRATAETLLDGAMADPEAARRFLKTIIRESDRLVRLSEDLLELSRAESGRRKETRFDLGGLLHDVAARLLASAEKRAVTVSLPPFGIEPGVFIKADRSEIDQVLFNLLDNAIKYTPSGGRVKATITPDTVSETVTVAVADTGIGILSQDLPRIFERFWRADRARRFSVGENGGPTTGGTGLGLSIVKHIVEAHKGTVRAESELGQGSRFLITLPLQTKEPYANDAA